MRFAILFLLCALTAAGAELSPKAQWRKMMADGEKERKAMVDELRSKQANASVEPEKSGVATRARIARKTEGIQAEIDAVEKQKGEYAPTIKNKEGSCGALRGSKTNQVTVRDIVDDSSMIVDLDGTKYGVNGYPTGDLKAGQRVELTGAFKNNGVVDVPNHGKVWVLEVLKKP